jgi:predicted membrane-bound mannosyltransferase
MISFNFIHYDDDRYPYVYAHTRRETLDLVNEIDRIAKRKGTGHETGIAIVSADYWPLPWYFRDYKRALFFGRFTTSDEPIVIGSVAEEEKLQQTFGDRYQLVGHYELRPGVNLILYVRRDMER